MIRNTEIKNITILQFYKNMYNGEIVEFNLLDNGTKAGKSSFMFSKDNNIESQSICTKNTTLKTIKKIQLHENLPCS